MDVAALIISLGAALVAAIVGYHAHTEAVKSYQIAEQALEVAEKALGIEADRRADE